MTYHNYISHYLFFIFIFHLFLEIASFIPVGRYGHSSELVGNKLYFFGGIPQAGGSSNEVFYLDVSQRFSIASPPWNDLTVNEGIPIKSSFGTVSLSEANNEQSIYLFGGITQDLVTNNDSSTSFTYKLNLKSGRWEIPVVKGKAPDRRRNMNSANDNSGKTYIFGGAADSFVGSLTAKYFNDMVIFNSVDSSWSINFQSNAPTARASYSATLLSNGVIVYIGGAGPTGSGFQLVDISQINLYDTKSSTWSVQTAKITGQIENRWSHTAVLAPNGVIIINGGSKIPNEAQVTPDIAVLNTETFEWTVPLVSSNIGVVPSLKSHTANLFGNNMIIAFGNVTQPNAPPLPLYNAKIYIMDIRSYTWIDTFVPTSSTNDPSNPSTTSSKPANTSENQQDTNQVTTTKVVIGTVSGIVGTAVLMIIGFFGYKRYRKYQQKKRNILEIHGNNQNEILGIHSNNTPY